MKRFYKNVTVQTVGTHNDTEYALKLDDKPIKTPMKNDFIIPNKKLADMIFTEWNNVTDDIMPDMMPMTGYMNSVIDNITHKRPDMNAMIAAYIENDGLCYFANRESDVELYAQQMEERMAVIDDFNEIYDLDIVITDNIMPIKQSSQVIHFAKDYVSALDDMAFAFFYQIVTLTGSFILGVAIMDNRLHKDIAWNLSRDEENMNIKRWGEDSLQTEKRAFADKQWHNAFVYLSALL
jgi:chaperone required for assembly of F1-ATPase